MARQFGNLRKLPSGRYQARYPAPDGRYVPAPTTFGTKKAASAWLADVQTSIEKNQWKSPEQLAAEDAERAAARAEVLTVAQLAEVWLETIPSENHRVISISRVRRFINPELGHIPIDELTKERCDRWYRDMNTTLCPRAPTQVRRTFAALHAMLKLAVHEDWIPASPLRIKGALIDTPAREPQTATVAEVDQLAAAMPAELSMAVQLAAWCGLRAGEVLGLQLDDIAEDRAVAGEGTGDSFWPLTWGDSLKSANRRHFRESPTPAGDTRQGRQSEEDQAPFSLLLQQLCRYSPPCCVLATAPAGVSRVCR
jgi:integrase